MKKKWLIGIFLLSQQHIYAADDDTQLRLNQELQQQQLQIEQQFKQQQNIDSHSLPTMVIDGEAVQVQPNVEEVGRALYIAVMQKQWQAAQIYLNRYLSFKDHDLSLAYFAQASLARVQGQTKQAEHLFQQALELQPDNMMIRLELARLWTEQQKNKEAKQLFEQVKQHLVGANDQISQNINHTIDLYLKTLNQRDTWQGNVALGIRHATNINNSSERYTLVPTIVGVDANGEYIIRDLKQGTPDPIDASALDYETVISKRWSLVGQHGLALKALGYGKSYQKQSDYNESTLNINAGYSFQNPRNQILVAPVFEHRRYANDTLSNAYGMRAEWMRFIGQDKALKLEAEIEDVDHILYEKQSGIEKSIFVTFWKVLPQQWTLFSGLDYVDHNTEEQYFAAYEQQGVRFGLSKPIIDGINLTVFGSLRWRQYDQYVNGFGFDTRRHDFEQNYTAVLQMPKFTLYGLTPNLTYNYNQNKSNVDWLYSNDKQSLSLKFEYKF